MAETLAGMKRTCRVSEFTEEQLDQELCVMGWAHRQRDLGKLSFITLRDRSGELQLVADEDSPAEVLEKAQKVRSEDVLAARGILRKRKDPNPEMKTGDYELHLQELRILSDSKTPPFYIEDDLDVRENLRLEYRYLDLRRPVMQEKLIKRHKITQFTRRWFDREGFLDIETPYLIKSTPEGARDYLVPSRVFPGRFFALPQSPQIYKQLLMCSGFDRYMQIARCFRDEDLRADRQPDFTQIDVEMSFVDQEEVMQTIERYVRDLFREIQGYEIPQPVPRMTWEEAMCRFGSDKPDLRFGMEIHDVSEFCKETEFMVFKGCIESGGTIQAIAVPGGAQIKRRRVDELTQFVKDNGGKGLVWMTVEDPVRGSATKFLDAGFVNKVAEHMGAKQGDMLLFVADEKYKALDVTGRLRLEVARSENMIPEGRWEMLWVTEFPMFEYDEEAGRYVAMHHPFTMPLEEDLPLLDTDPAAVRAHAYDFVLNGNELGGGSIRIHDRELQKKIFELVGLSPEMAAERFGFLLKAFEYGVPPHGGLAFGLDRMVMLLSGSTSIRDVIAFPKVQNSSCLMSNSPSEVDPNQLEELGLILDPERCQNGEANEAGEVNDEP